jgi:beta-N-acetylhexosaminidase
VPHGQRVPASPRALRAGATATRRHRAAVIRRRRAVLAFSVLAVLVALITVLTGSSGSTRPGAAASSPGSGAAGSGGASSSGAGGAAPTKPGAGQIPIPASSTRLLGQRVMVGVQGEAPDAALLRRVRRGEVGSVILFSPNIASQSQTLALTGALQRAARAGGNPPLLIAVDQEGGQVKRLPGGPPRLSPPQIAATGKVSVARSEGLATGRFLRRWGINMDLAPVSDVPTFGRAFIWRQGRAFSFSAGSVTSYAGAFASGLQAAHAAATAKHFPGVGSAGTDTDFKLDDLHPTAAQRSAALLPYRTMIPHGLDAVMVATARFPDYDASDAPAALSKPIIQGLLRGQLGFRGVAITDALGTPTGHDETTAGVLAATAGADILLFTDSAPHELAALGSALAHGRIARADAAASYRRIVALKRKLAAG